MRLKIRQLHRQLVLLIVHSFTDAKTHKIVSFQRCGDAVTDQNLQMQGKISLLKDPLCIGKTSAPLGAWKSSFPTFMVTMTDRPTGNDKQPDIRGHREVTLSKRKELEPRNGLNCLPCLIEPAEMYLVFFYPSKIPFPLTKAICYNSSGNIILGVKKKKRRHCHCGVVISGLERIINDIFKTMRLEGCV